MASSADPPDDAGDPVPVSVLATPRNPLPIITADTEKLEARDAGFPGESAVVVGGYYERVHYGPLPDGETLADLAKVYQKAPEIIFKEYVAQAAHRRAMEKLVTESNVRLASTGQWIGGGLGFVGLVVSGIVAALDHGPTGATIATGSLVSLVSVFVYGRRSQRKERAEKAAIRAGLARGEPVASIEVPAKPPDPHAP